MLTNEEHQLTVGAAGGTKRPLTQAESDAFLFYQMAQLGSVDMAESRADAVVQNMIRMRDEGDHPSVISAADRLTSERSRPRQRMPAVHEYEEEEEVPSNWRPSAAAQITEFDSVSNIHERRQPRHKRYEDEDERRSRHSHHSHHSHHSRHSHRSDRDRSPARRARSPRRDRSRTPPRRDRSRTPPRRDRSRSPPPKRDSRSYTSDAAKSLGSVKQRAKEAERPASRASSRHSAFGTGGDIASRYAKPSSKPSPFALVMQRQLAELNAPPKSPSLPPLLPPQRANSSSVAASNASAHRAPPRVASRDSAIESSVSHPSRRGNNTGGRYSDRKNNASHREREEEEERQTRHELIMELDKCEITFSEEDPTWKLKHMLERVMANRMSVAKVKFIRLGIQIGSTLVETLVMQFLPRLRLRGWAEGLNKDMATGNYDIALEQVYRKLFRKGGMPSPWIILITVIFGSAVLHVIGMRGSGGTAEEGGSGPVTQFSNLFAMFGPMVAGLTGSLGGGGAAATPRPTARATSTTGAPTTTGERKRPKIAPV